MTRLGLAALVTLGVTALLVVAGPLLWTIAPETTNPAQGLAGPSAVHPLGTDELGRDVLSRLLHGGRVTLLVGVAAMLASLLIGVIVGAIAGIQRRLARRGPDALHRRDARGAGVLLHPRRDHGRRHERRNARAGDRRALVDAGRTRRLRRDAALEDVRVRRGRGLARRVRRRACSCGTSFRRRSRRSSSSATLGVAFAILTESALSYLAFGVQPPLPSWGNMLQRAQQYVFTAPALALYPGLAITAVVLAFNFLGDGLRDALDPRRRR